MNSATKAMLISAFIFPGGGHLYLRRYAIGAVLMLVALIALGFITVHIFERAFAISDQILNGRIAPDIVTISRMVSEQPAGPEARLVNLSTYALLSCWLLGIIDSYRLGHRQDQKDQTG